MYRTSDIVQNGSSIGRTWFRECYNKHKRICPGDSYDEGELVAVKLRSQWHRGRFIEYKSNIDFAHVSDDGLDWKRSLTTPCFRSSSSIRAIRVPYPFKWFGRSTIVSWSVTHLPIFQCDRFRTDKN